MPADELIEQTSDLKTKESDAEGQASSEANQKLYADATLQLLGEKIPESKQEPVQPPAPTTESTQEQPAGTKTGESTNKIPQADGCINSDTGPLQSDSSATNDAPAVVVPYDPNDMCFNLRTPYGAPKSPRGYVTVPVFYATNREAQFKDGKLTGYGAKAEKNEEVHRGVAYVMLPLNYQDPPKQECLQKLGMLYAKANLKDAGLSSIKPYGPGTVNNGVSVETAFQSDLKARVDASPRKELTIYVHGVANTFESAVISAAKKSLDTMTPVMALSWPSDDSFWQYNKSVTSAELSIDTVEHELTALRPVISPLNTNLSLHSRGVDTTLKALKQYYLGHQDKPQQMLPYHSISAGSADSHSDFVNSKQTLDIISRMSCMTWFLVSKKDLALSFAEHIWQQPRAGHTGITSYRPNIWTIDYTEMDENFYGHSYPDALVTMQENYMRGNDCKAGPGPMFEQIMVNGREILRSRIGDDNTRYYLRREPGVDNRWSAHTPASVRKSWYTGLGQGLQSDKPSSILPGLKSPKIENKPILQIPVMPQLNWEFMP